MRPHSFARVAAWVVLIVGFLALLFFGFYPKAISQPVDQTLAAPAKVAILPAPTR